MIVAPLALTEMECVIQEGLQVMILRVDKTSTNFGTFVGAKRCVDRLRPIRM